MKKYLFIVLLVGYAFGQIVPDTLIMKSGRIHIGTYYGKDDYNTEFKFSKSTEREKIRNIQIKEIRLGDEKKITNKVEKIKTDKPNPKKERIRLFTKFGYDAGELQLWKKYFNQGSGSPDFWGDTTLSTDIGFTLGIDIILFETIWPKFGIGMELQQNRGFTNPTFEIEEYDMGTFGFNTFHLIIQFPMGPYILNNFRYGNNNFKGDEKFTFGKEYNLDGDWYYSFSTLYGPMDNAFMEISYSFASGNIIYSDNQSDWVQYDYINISVGYIFDL